MDAARPCVQLIHESPRDAEANAFGGGARAPEFRRPSPPSSVRQPLAIPVHARSAPLGGDEGSPEAGDSDRCPEVVAQSSGRSGCLELRVCVLGPGLNKSR